VLSLVVNNELIEVALAFWQIAGILCGLPFINAKVPPGGVYEIVR
jgi:hypothetical protein